MAIFTKSLPLDGELYERLIGLINIVLNKSLQKRVVDIEMFNTSVAHAQFTINHRPLLYVTQNDGDMPITPDMLLHGRNFYISNILKSEWTKV